MRRAGWWIAAVVVGVAAAFGQSQTQPAAGRLPGRLETLLRKFERHKSVRAKLTSELNVASGNNRVERRGRGTIELRRKGRVWLYRREMKYVTQTQIGQQKLKIDQSELIIDDGRLRYVMREAMGRTSAIKTRSAPLDDADPRVLFETLRATHTLRLSGEKQLDGQRVLLVEARPRTPNPTSPYQLSVYAISLEHGGLVQLARKDKDGKPVETIRWSDYVFDQPIDPKRFEFKPPEGVEVIDRT